MLPKLLTGQERRNLRQIDPALIFSAKEATYKLLYPLFGVYVDFLEVEISLIEKKASFTVHYVGKSVDHRIVERARGVYTRLDDHWISCTVLP